MMDESRKQFEEWYSISMKERVSWYTDKNVTNDLTLEVDGSYMRDAVRDKWEAWQASRAAIEVELPSLKQTDSGERYVWSDAVYNFKEDAIAVIESAGLKVKQ